MSVHLVLLVVFFIVFILSIARARSSVNQTKVLGLHLCLQYVFEVSPFSMDYSILSGSCAYFCYTFYSHFVLTLSNYTLPFPHTQSACIRQAPTGFSLFYTVTKSR